MLCAWESVSFKMKSGPAWPWAACMAGAFLPARVLNLRSFLGPSSHPKEASPLTATLAPWLYLLGRRLQTTPVLCHSWARSWVKPRAPTAPHVSRLLRSLILCEVVQAGVRGGLESSVRAGVVRLFTFCRLYTPQLRGLSPGRYGSF